MGTRGTQPLPTAVKQARGTYRPDRAATNEALPLGKCSCPKWITNPDVKKEFNRLAKTLGKMGLVGASDINLLARYAVAWVRWRRIAQILESNPGAEFASFKDEKGVVKHVQISALNSAARSLADELGRCEGVLGMSPSSRSRIEVTIPPDKTDEAVEHFFTDGPQLKIAQ